MLRWCVNSFAVTPVLPPCLLRHCELLNCLLVCVCVLLNTVGPCYSGALFQQEGCDLPDFTATNSALHNFCRLIRYVKEMFAGTEPLRIHAIETSLVDS